MEEPLTAENNVFKNISTVIPILGGFGRFQHLLIALFGLMIFPSTFTVLLMYFTALNPPWKCAANSSVCLGNATFPSDNKDRCAMQRSDWEFTEERGYSIVTQFDVYCEKEWVIHLTTSILFIGWGIGAIFLGWISDNYGRKVVLFPSYFLIMVTGFVSAFSPTLPFLVTCRFIIGFFVPGTGVQCIVLLSEFVSTKYRPHSIIIIWFCFSTALCVLSLKAYYTKEWYILFIICTVPYLFIMAFYKFIPESIRWLHLHGKVDELWEVFHRMAYWNGKELPAGFTILPLDNPNSHKSSPLDLFRTRKMASQSCIQGYAWLVNGMVYYGLSLAASDLGGSLYRNFALLSAIEIPANMLAIFLCYRVGRKRTTCGGMAVASISCLAIAFIPSTGNVKVLRIVLGMVGKCCITMSFSGVYTWSLELYNTNLRAEGMGFLQVTSRIGAASSPWIAKALKSLHHAAPFIIMGSLSLFGALSLLFLPETKGKPIQETSAEKNFNTDSTTAC